MAAGNSPNESSFLIVARGGRDAEVIAQLLRSASIDCEIDGGERLLQALVDGSASGAVITDEAVSRLDPARLREAIERQPPWSDFPLVLLTRRGEMRQGSRAVEDLLNITVLERPLHPATLISAVRSAIRGRARQRLAADYLAEREAAEARLVQAQKMEAIGQLTGGIAHDFNNLLTAVVGSLELLLRRTDEEKLRRLAGNALQAAERGAKLTAQLLAFSRRQRLSPVALDINLVIEGMRDLLVRSIGPQIEIETKLEPDIWRALADPTQLEVMLLNLAINARDAMPQGGRIVIATMNVASVPDTLAAELDEREYVCIRVTDNGRGMPPDVLAHAFEPFFTTKPHGKGTGLGLAQLYGFARQSGGTAKIQSDLGKGTAVSIYLPRTHERVTQEALSRSKTHPARRARILVVDDDDDVRTVTCETVKELGYEVVALGDPAEALARLNDEPFDLLITDVAMPGISGVDVARQIRSAGNAIPIVFCSGYADVQAFGEELSEEILLRKPFRLTDIASRIEAALDPSSVREVASA